MPGRLEYTRPVAREPTPNAITLERPLDDVWKTAIPALGARFFVINNIDRSSGLINLSYAGDPQLYVDCGQASSYVRNLRGERTHNFAGAAPHTAYEFVGSDGELYFVDRTMKLEGRINVIFQQLAPDQTKVTANTRYIVTRTGQARNAAGVPAPSRTETINFDSGQGASFPERGRAGALHCLATGRLERELLDLLR